jgi:hypothetical protein
MTQRANLRAPRRNDLAAAPAQLPYSDFLSLRSGHRDPPNALEIHETKGAASTFVRKESRSSP